jgi:carbon-monoxide dehydrogenase small subunit
MAATALLARNPRPTAPQVRAGMTGNLCRCSNYNAIVEAILAASGSATQTTAGNGGAQ